MELGAALNGERMPTMTKDAFTQGVENDPKKKSTQDLKERTRHDQRMIGLTHEVRHSRVGIFVGIIQEQERQNPDNEIGDNVYG
ncbi:MAG: hypothetical protein DYG86_03775 [Chloroflexi bacterium CFX2]|nr:hypothetical protein [Chloroflexi bacterium CFX2]